MIINSNIITNKYTKFMSCSSVFTLNSVYAYDDHVSIMVCGLLRSKVVLGWPSVMNGY